MSKYSPLSEFLRKHTAGKEVRMTFAQIERITGAKLPPSARRHRAWWSNNPQSSVITRAWLEAGFQTKQVDLQAGTLVFRRAQAAPKPGPKILESHPLFGALKGLMRVAPGTDLAQPAEPEWGRDG